MDNIYKNIEEYNPNKKKKMLIVFDDMIADMLSNKKLNSIVTEFFIRGRKINISLVFIMQSYFKVSKDVRLNTTHFFIMKIPNKKELQQIVYNHSSDINFKDFMSLVASYAKILHRTFIPTIYENFKSVFFNRKFQNLYTCLI